MPIETIATVLAAMNSDGGFPLSLLVDREGLVIAGATANGHDPEEQAAALALIQGAVEKSASMGLGPIDELTLRTTRGERFVCRRVAGGKNQIHMGVIVPKGRCYRRITNRALRELSQILQDF